MISQQKSDLIPITLLTGFLGSGKSTVLNHLLKQSELSDALVIINEFGETGLDHLLVAHSTEVPVAQMNSGCVCCTIRNDLIKTLRDVTWRFSRQGKRQFGRVVIETTGLADPAPIINTLMTNAQVSAKYKLDGVVTVVEMVNGADTLAKHDEAVKQIALADILLLTKGDLIEDRKSDALEEQIDAINALAPRHRIRNGVVNPQKLINLELGAVGENRFGVHSTNTPDHHHEDDHHDDHHHNHDGHHGHDHLHHHAREDGINAYCFLAREPVPADMLDEWLKTLEGFMGDKILRVKGVLHVSGHEKPLIIHGVQHLLHPVTPLQSITDDNEESQVVFITQDIGRAEIEYAFRKFNGVIPSK